MNLGRIVLRINKMYKYRRERSKKIAPILEEEVSRPKIWFHFLKSQETVAFFFVSPIRGEKQEPIIMCTFTRSSPKGNQSQDFLSKYPHKHNTLVIHT